MAVANRGGMNPGPARSAVLMALATLGGCVSASAVRLGDATYPPRPTDYRIAVFDTLADVDRPYDKVGRVVGEGSDSAAFAAIVASMQEQARQLGADALVLSGGGLLLSGDGDCGTAVDRSVHGLLLRWR
jgi:hypothetical protein